jgi:1-deoxy-D-xylulose-5-phosphate reductoisomerase
MKKIAVLGSSGSIGQNTLEVVKSLNKNGFPVSVGYLSVNSNIEVLQDQIRWFHPKAVVIFNQNAYSEFKKLRNEHECEILYGLDGVIEVIQREDYDLVVNALVGFAGLAPTIEVINHGKDIALANKESLVVAGELINKLLGNSGSKLLPIDSEHSAILQCIRGEPLKQVTRLTLTASGGPFLNYSKDALENVSVEEALNHPNWKMGNKITIDSATLINKGFEIIEGKWLFGMNVEDIEVLIHPQSIVHSLVEFSDGSVKAQLGVPDMKIPIQYAITYPERVASDYPRLNLSMLKELTFIKPDFKKFECLKLAYDVMKSGSSYPVVLNASNEVAVDMFLNRKIKFTEIPKLINLALDRHENIYELDLENIREIDRRTREFVSNSVVLYE